MTLKLYSSGGFTSVDAHASADNNALVLPEGNGTAGQVLQTDGNGNLSWLTLPTYNDVIDTWRLTGGTSGDQDPITANWEREDETGSVLVGGGVSESSGVFTFPKTGMYLIKFHLAYNISGDERYCDTYIIAATNGSNWNNIAKSSGSIKQVDSANTNSSVTLHALFDVKDLLHAVRFAVYFSNNSCTTNADTNISMTYASFIRLTDT